MTKTKHVIAATKTLPPQRFEQFCRRFLGLGKKQYEEGLPDFEQLLTFVLEWLNHLGLFSDADQEIVISTYKNQFQQWLTNPKVTFLVISDGRYVSLTGGETFLDVQTGDKLEELPRPALTLVICSINELFLRKKKFIDALETGDEQQHSSTSGVNANDSPADD